MTGITIVLATLVSVGVLYAAVTRWERANMAAVYHPAGLNRGDSKLAEQKARERYRAAKRQVRYLQQKIGASERGQRRSMYLNQLQAAQASLLAATCELEEATRTSMATVTKQHRREEALPTAA